MTSRVKYAVLFIILLAVAAGALWLYLSRPVHWPVVVSCTETRSQPVAELAQNTLVYRARVAQRHVDIFVLSADGRCVNITNTPDILELKLHVAANGRILAFEGIDRTKQLQAIGILDCRDKTCLMIDTGGYKASLPRVNPTGELVAFRVNKKGFLQVWLYNVAQKKVITRVGFKGNNCFPTRFSPDGRYLLWIKTHPRKNKSRDIWRLDCETLESERLLAGNGMRHSKPIYINDREILYSSNTISAEHNDRGLFIFDCDSHTSRPYLSQAGYVFHPYLAAGPLACVAYYVNTVEDVHVKDSIPKPQLMRRILYNQNNYRILDLASAETIHDMFDCAGGDFNAAADLFCYVKLVRKQGMQLYLVRLADTEEILLPPKMETYPDYPRFYRAKGFSPYWE